MEPSEEPRTVAAAYDRLAPRYHVWADAVTPPLRETYARRVVAALEPGTSVLEIGCGPGVPVAALLARHFKIVGVDVSAGMVTKAREAVPSAEFLVADIADATFETGRFGGVVAFYSLIHVPRDSPRAAVRQDPHVVDAGRRLRREPGRARSS